MDTTLRAQIKQRRPFGSHTQEAFLNLVRTAAALEHAFEDALKPFGVTATQYNVLRILRGAGEEGLCRNEVGQRMLKPVPDVTRLLDRLEDSGLVARLRDAEDRRFVTARITKRGLARLASLDGPVTRMHEELLGHMEKEDLGRLAKLLEESRERMA